MKSKGVAMCDGVWNLVAGNSAVVIRLGTATRNGKYRDMAYTLASGETAWVKYSMHTAFQKLAETKFHMDPKELYLSWHIIDGSLGFLKGLL
jgi:hypothetical protein